MKVLYAGMIQGLARMESGNCAWLKFQQTVNWVFTWGKMLAIMKTATLIVLALCVLVSPSNLRAGVTDDQRADYVQKTWGLASDGSDAAQYFADKLNIQYDGIPFKDYVTALVTANQLAAQLENKDYYDAARTATGYATDLSLAAIYDEFEITGPVGVVSFSSGLIGLSLDYVNWSVDQDAFNEQCSFYFAAREQVELSSNDILTANDENKGVLFDDSGWIHTIYSDTVSLSSRAGVPNNYTSAQFFAIAEQLYLQHKNQLALQADSQQIGQAFRQTLQPTGPTFTTDLSDQTITDGQTAVFSVVVNGVGPFQYVWSVNRIPLSGPYGSSFSATEAGTYQVTVYDANQLQAVSRLATLTVNPSNAPIIIGSPAQAATVSGICNVRASAPLATKVEFYLFDASLGLFVKVYTASTTPFIWTWDTKTATNNRLQHIQVIAYSGTNILGSIVRLVRVNNSIPEDCNDSNEPNNNSLTGTWLPLGTNINGYICTPTDVDWFRIPVTSAGVITVSLAVPAGLDFDLELYGPDSAWKAGSYHGPGISENITLTNSTTGIYYARVYGYPIGNGSHSTTNAYTIAAYQTGIPLSTVSNGLVAYYPFSGNANDASGNGNNGTVVGAVLTKNRFGEVNSAYYFGGSSSIVFPNPPPLASQGSFTYSLWLNASTTPSSPGWWCLDRAAETTPLVSLGIGQNSALLNQFNFLPRYDDGTTVGSGDGGRIFGGNLTPQKWQLVTMVREFGNAFKFYVDGQLVVSAPDNGKPLTPPIVKLGEHAYGIMSFIGGMDDFRIYNRALSDSEVQQLYSQESSFPQPNLSDGLVAHYPLAGNANDTSGNGNNGTAYNASYTTNLLGQLNAAFNFNGVNSRIAVPDSPILILTNSLTLAAFINPGSSQNQYESQIIFRGDDRSGLDPYSIEMRGNGTVAFMLENDNNTVALQAPITVMGIGLASDGAS